ncbi:MAG: hypothetical protein ACI96N_003251, partial [Arenicella sp.]
PPNYKKPLIAGLAVFFRLKFSELQQCKVYGANLSSRVQIPISPPHFIDKPLFFRGFFISASF